MLPKSFVSPPSTFPICSRRQRGAIRCDPGQNFFSNGEKNSWHNFPPKYYKFKIKIHRESTRWNNIYNSPVMWWNWFLRIKKRKEKKKSLFSSACASRSVGITHLVQLVSILTFVLLFSFLLAIIKEKKQKQKTNEETGWPAIKTTLEILIRNWAIYSEA